MLGLILAYVVVAGFNAFFSILLFKQASMDEREGLGSEEIMRGVIILRRIAVAFSLMGIGGILAILTVVIFQTVGKLLSLGVLIVFIASGGIKLHLALRSRNQ
jgi:hypothetical protein